MRFAPLLLLSVVLWGACCSTTQADHPHLLRHRHRWGGLHRHHAWWPGSSTFSLSVGYGWPSSYYYSATHGYGGLVDGCVTIGSPYVYVVPPVVEPAEWHFGPQALDRFLGLNRNAGNPLAVAPQFPQPAGGAGLAPAAPGFPAVGGGAIGGGAIGGGAARAGDPAAGAAAARDAADPLRRPDVRQSNPQARQRAGRYLLFGDNLFAEQQFHQALQRYKSAAEAAPDLAEPYFRQGHALIATNRFDLAADAFRRGLALSQDVARDGFRLSDLYGDAVLASSSHIEALAEAALNRPDDADPLFLLGLMLFYDGQGERAKPLLERAAGLSLAARRFTQPYLDALQDEQVVGIDL